MARVSICPDLGRAARISMLRHFESCHVNAKISQEGGLVSQQCWINIMWLDILQAYFSSSLMLWKGPPSPWQMPSHSSVIYQLVNGKAFPHLWKAVISIYSWNFLYLCLQPWWDICLVNQDMVSSVSEVRVTITGESQVLERPKPFCDSGLTSCWFGLFNEPLVRSCHPLLSCNRGGMVQF